MKRCDYCGHDAGIDVVSAPDQIGVMHYSKISCAEKMKAERDALLLQLDEARKLLAKVEEQGLYHTCGMEGYLAAYGCDECRAATEQEILKFLGAKLLCLTCGEAHTIGTTCIEKR